MGNNRKEYKNKHLPKSHKQFQEHEMHFRQCTVSCRVRPLCTLTHSHTHTLTHSHTHTLTHSPPMTPYVSMRTLTLGEKVLRMKAAHPMMLPAMHTVRHPNLFVSALTMGPATCQLTLDLTRVAASKCSRNHRISGKHKRVQSFKLYFLQNSPIVQKYTSNSHCKGGNIL